MKTDSACDNLAVLIDGDNVSHKIIAGLMAEVANYGTASVRRIYGDWTSSAMKGWRECLLEHSFTPIQQFAYSTGKNATDGAMIIDAMDLLYTGRFSSFCIVSNDSDFTRLAARIREQGISVYGFGKRNYTGRALVAACSEFVYFDALQMPADDPDESGAPSTNIVSKPAPSSDTLSDAASTLPTPVTAKKGSKAISPRKSLRPKVQEKASSGSVRKPIDKAARSAIKKAIDSSTVHKDGCRLMSEIAEHLNKISPDINARNYGYEYLMDFITASGLGASGNER